MYVFRIMSPSYRFETGRERAPQFGSLERHGATINQKLRS